jgi:hypothetical protein
VLVGQLAQFLLVDLYQVFLLFLFSKQQFSLVVFAFPLDLSHLLAETGFTLLDRAFLGDCHLLLRLDDLDLTGFLNFSEFLLVGLRHGVVLLHPTLVFELTLVFGEIEAVRPFLGLLLVRHLEFNLLESHVFVELLDFELQLDLQHFGLLFPHDAPIACAIHH